MIILFIADPKNAIAGLGIILKGGFGDPAAMVRVVNYAIPITMTGLSVGFAFRTGLFNIGAAGQFTLGAFFAIFVGVKWTFLPAPLHWFVAFLAAMLGGALVGLVPGFLKAVFNVNEVIASIMMNYISMYFVNMQVKRHIYDSMKNQSRPTALSARTPKLGLDELFGSKNIDMALLIVILFVILTYIIIEKTTFGYELKACGLNPDASRYAGINARRNTILAMVIAGALAGVGGALMYLGHAGKYIRVLDVLASEGFNGIAVALLGMSHPIGIFFSGLFIGHITIAGNLLQRFDYVPETIDMIIAAIIYCGALALLFKNMLLARLNKKGDLS